MGSRTRVGLLVLVALAILMATIFTLGRQERMWERKVHYEVHFARANGLQEGAQVSLGGVVVGSVESIAFPADLADRYVAVRIAVAGAVAPRVRENTQASVRTLGLLGDRYIELNPGTPDLPAIPDGGLITAVDPVDYEAVLGQSGDIVTNVVEVTASLRDVLQTIQRGEGLLGAMVTNREFGRTTLENLEGTLANVRATSARLEGILARVDQGQGLLGRLVRDTPESDRLLARLDHAVREFDGLASRLGRGGGAAMRLVEDREYGDRLLADLGQAVRDLREVADKMNRGDGTLGRLVNDPALYDESRALVHDVRGSWMLSIYRAIRGAWPFGGGDEPSPEGPPPAAGTLPVEAPR